MSSVSGDVLCRGHVKELTSPEIDRVNCMWLPSFRTSTRGKSVYRTVINMSGRITAREAGVLHCL